MASGFWAKPGSDFVAKTLTCSAPTYKSATEDNSKQAPAETNMLTPQIPEESICIFPNPAKTSVTVKIAPTLFPCKLGLYDLNGHIVRQIQNIKSNVNVLQLDGLSKGVYFIRINNQNVVFNSTFRL
jgi:hypothetical protein